MIDVTAIQKTHKLRQQPQVIIPRGLNELEGFTRFYLDVNIAADTMLDWSAQQITDFFDGVAKIIRTRGKPES